MPITLYHVSFDQGEPLHKVFEPRVPESVGNGEDEKVRRVCFSDSIVGCIRGIQGDLKADCADIVVWQHRFDEDDRDLLNWKYLYYRGLVPDAAVTHEYWYLKRIELDGKRYRIEAAEHETFLIIPPQYKGVVLRILAKYATIDLALEQMDPCTIVNEWVHEQLAGDEIDIREEIREKVVRNVERPADPMTRRLFGDDEDLLSDTICDADPLEVLTGCTIRELG